MLLATLICTDDGCAVTVEAWGSPEELDVLVCDDCGCVLQTIGFSEPERPAQVHALPARPPARRLRTAA